MDIIIVNPQAGKKQGLKYLEVIKGWYQEINREFLVCETKNSNHAKALARYYSHIPEVKNIVSVGGDGTIHEIVNGMINTNKGLIVIPAGTGNDFYKSIANYPEDFLCDIGKANDEYFVCILSIGLDALIADHANGLKEKGISGNVYIKSLFEILPDLKNYRVLFQSDSAIINRHLLMLSFCNTNYYGRGIKLAPGAMLDDGLLDVYVVDCLKKYQVPIILLKVLLGIHEKDHRISSFKTIGGLITFNRKMLYSFDGECRYGEKIDLSLCKNKLLIKKDFHKEIKKLTKSYF